MIRSSIPRYLRIIRGPKDRLHVVLTNTPTLKTIGWRDHRWLLLFKFSLTFWLPCDPRSFWCCVIISKCPANHGCGRKPGLRPRRHAASHSLSGEDLLATFPCSFFAWLGAVPDIPPFVWPRCTRGLAFWCAGNQRATWVERAATAVQQNRCWHDRTSCTASVEYFQPWVSSGAWNCPSNLEARRQNSVGEDKSWLLIGPLSPTFCQPPINRS